MVLSCVLELDAIRNWLVSIHIVVDFHSLATRVLSTLKCCIVRKLSFKYVYKCMYVCTYVVGRTSGGWGFAPQLIMLC